MTEVPFRKPPSFGLSSLAFAFLSALSGCQGASDEATRDADGPGDGQDAGEVDGTPDSDGADEADGNVSGEEPAAPDEMEPDPEDPSTDVLAETEEVTLRTLLGRNYLRVTPDSLRADGTKADAIALRLFDEDGGELLHGDVVQLLNAEGEALLIDKVTFQVAWSEQDEGTSWTLLRVKGEGAVGRGDQVGLSWGSAPNYLKALDGGGGDLSGDAPWMQGWETFVLDRLSLPEPEGFQTLAFLSSIAGTQIVSGQHNDQKDGTDENHYTERVHEITGKYPGLYGADFLFHDSADMRWKITYEAERQWEAGAMINIMWHACPPTQGESCQWNGGLLSGMTDGQWTDLITDGGNLNGIWKQRMDDIAVYLTYLRDAGVEVMFRPLHEQNQGAFWWGGRTGDGGTRALFRLTHDYLTNDKGLNNLIWVWDVQDLSTNYGDYGPGDDYFDIAALDIYADAYTNPSYYNALRTSAGDKLVAIGECFRLPSEQVLSAQPEWAFFMNWAYGLEVDLNGNQSNSVEYIREVYENPRVLTLDEMPGWN